MALEYVVLVAGLALAALGVGLEEINEIVGLFALGIDHQGLRISTAVDIAPESIA